MGRFEVTTSQWAAFMSAVDGREDSDAILFISPPGAWGGVIDGRYTGPGRRYVAARGREMMSVGNISWRTAAIYCNWLHNGQSTARSAFMNGAYDVSTFGYLGGSSIFSDQLVHNPDAKFFIPNTDEWIKAAHYDPNKNGAGRGGWWRYSITSDTTPVYAPPGVLQNGRLGQSNSFGIGSFPGYGPGNIMLGAYSAVQSPWGLFDTSGGCSEWNEDAWLAFGTNPAGRYIDSSAWGDGTTQANISDQISYIGSDYPSIDYADYGFRIAAAIPSPGGVAVFGGLLLLQSRRRRSNCLRTQ